MIIIKNAEEIESLRRAGRVVAGVRDAVAARVAPGVSTGELAAFAGERIAALGAASAFLGYRGYPGMICVSVNDEVVHGIPGERRILPGDIVSVDVGVRYEGFIGDTATTVMVGVTDPAVTRLVEATKQGLTAGIAQACEGNRLSDISHAIETVARDAGVFAVRDFVGHGIGRAMHEEPQVPNFGRAGRGPRLRRGMTLAIEPMFAMGGSGVKVLEDGWTAVTRSGGFAAHFEHVVAIGKDGPEILTRQE